MNRNSEEFFRTMPNIEKPRSKWTRPFNHKTTGNAGDLIPFYVETDIIPGTTIKNSTSILCRMNTPKYQTMDTLILDTYWFKINWWTIWESTFQFFGENETGTWAVQTEKTIPMFKTDATHVNGIHDTNCHMGLPYNTQCEPWNKFAVRSYIRVWNYYFRDKNLMAPLTMYKGDGDTVIDNTEVTGGKLLPVCKTSDIFTRALPEPAKVPPFMGPNGNITSPIGTIAPIVTGSDINFNNVYGSGTTANAMKVMRNDGTQPGQTNGLAALNDGTVANMGTGSPGGARFIPGNLWADLSQAVAATINAQRLAWSTQRVFERDGIFGTSYFQDSLRAHWGVETDQGIGFLPEYLGGTRQRINIQEIVQSSETSSTSPLGFTGGYSVTNSINEDFIKSFDQHSVLLGLMCVRIEHHSYQQGVERMWTKKRRLDFYHPEMAHIGNTQIYNYEIFSDGSSNDKGTFGFKEAWAEHKYKNNLITGELKSTYSQSLDAWHYGDDYTGQAPVLSANWIVENKEWIDRTLLIPSSQHDQFTFDIYVEQEIAAPIPLHCMPGLVDHF